MTNKNMNRTGLWIILRAKSVECQKMSEFNDLLQGW